MNSASWLDHLLTASLQTALLLAIGLSLPYCLRIYLPELRLAWWRTLLVAVLLLPFGSLWPQAIGAFAERYQVALWPALPIVEEANALSSFPWQYCLLGLAMAGAIRGLTRLGIGYLALQRHGRYSQLFDLPPERIARAEKLTGASASIRHSDRVTSPVTYGWRRPVILLPSSFRQLSPAAQDSVLCHELLHVRRHDWPVTVIEQTLRAVLWFHPAVWLLLDRISLSREQIIDRQVVRLLKTRRPYFRALWSFAHQAYDGKSLAAVSFLHRSHLVRRVKLLTQEIEMSKKRMTLSSLSLLAGLALTGVFGLCLFPWNAGAVPADSEEILRVEGDVVKPQRLSGDAPAYPPLPKEEKIEGKVIVRSTINQSGEIEAVEIMASPGPAFDAEVRKALQTWRFTPATLDGEPVKVHYFLTINFNLDSKKENQKT